MRVLVVGGAGFLGRHLVQRLVAEAHDVTVLDPADGSASWTDHVVHVRPEAPGNESVADLMAAQDAVYLLATTSSIPDTWAAPEHEVRKNLLPTLSYAQAAAAAGIRRIAMASSGGTVYGPFDGLADEDHPARPDTPYGVTKLAAEGLLHYLGRRFEVSTDVYRIGNIYGPGQPAHGSQGVIGHWLRAIREGRPLQMYGDPGTLRDYVFVEDVARRMTWSLRDSTDDGTWNVGTGRATSLQDLVDLLSELHGTPLEVEAHPGRGFDVPSNVLDGRRLDAHFPDAPYIPIEEGLKRTWAAESRRP